MSRPLRLEFAGALYHVTSRGNEKRNIFWEDSDFDLFLEVLGDVCDRFNWLIHAYCLMTNHYHLLVETPDGNLSKGMRQLNGVYTQRFNRKHRRVGHLYQGRYKSILVDKESYLLELSRYIVLNPVRAKNMAGTPEEWPCSSYQAVIGITEVPDWLAVDALLLMFSKQKEKAVDEYKKFVAQGMGVDVWGNLKSQVFLGSEEFVEKYKQQAEADLDIVLSEVPKKQTRAKAEPLAFYQAKYNKDKKKGMLKAYRTGQYSMAEVASAFGVHYSTVSRVVAKCKT